MRLSESVADAEYGVARIDVVRVIESQYLVAQGDHLADVSQRPWNALDDLVGRKRMTTLAHALSGPYGVQRWVVEMNDDQVNAVVASMP